MGWLDKLKVKLGVLDAEDAMNLEEDEPRAERRARGDRPSLDGIEPASQQGLDDVLAAREAGDRTEMRRLLRELDRGRGLRLVLRAAAALEANDEAELAELLPKFGHEEQPWRLSLQLASVLDDPKRAEAWRAHAIASKAPRWALAWSRAASPDPEERRRGLVELLVADPALARTVAARELNVEGAVADPDGADRFAAFAHGQQCIRRFGATLVADVLERAGVLG